MTLSWRSHWASFHYTMSWTVAWVGLMVPFTRETSQAWRQKKVALRTVSRMGPYYLDLVGALEVVAHLPLNPISLQSSAIQVFTV